MRQFIINVLSLGSFLALLATEAQASTVRIGDLELELITPQSVSYVDGISFTLVNESAPGSANASLTPVDLDLGPGNSSNSGCESEDFVGFPSGNVALVQRGSCGFITKVENAEAAGASAVLLFNSGVDGGTQGLTGITLSESYTGALPVFFLTYPLGEALAGLANPSVRIESPVFRGPPEEAYLRYCLANGSKCSLSVKDVDADWERHLNPDRPQTTASTFKILSLIAYAEAVVAGELSPDEVITRDEWAAFSVGLDGGALGRVFERLEEPATVSVDELMRAMMRESDNAAPDWLLNRLGQQALSDVVTTYVDGLHDVPTSINAQIASFFALPDEPGIATRLLADYSGHADPGFQDELADRFFNDMQDLEYVAGIRERYCSRLPWEPATPCSPSFSSTRSDLIELLGRYFTRGTSGTYLRLAEQLLANELLAPPVAAEFGRHMEYRLEFKDVAASFARYGAKGGSFSPQNVCNWVAYHEDAATGALTVVTTMIQDSLHFCGFEIQPWAFAEAFALDEDFRERVRDESGFDVVFRDRFANPTPPRVAQTESQRGVAWNAGYVSEPLGSVAAIEQAAR